MKMHNKIQLLGLIATLFIFPIKIKAQYCAPSMTTNGVYINLISFNNSTVTGGIQQYTGVNNGYTPATTTSSGTVSRYFGFSFDYGLGNPTESKQSYNFAYYGDWNNDGDFDDAGEQQLYPLVGAFNPGSSTTGNTIFPPLVITPGNYRLRFAVKQDSSGLATACGSYTGEVEDYIITIRANTAPVLNTSAIPVLNTITSDQTNSNGIAISELVGSTEPSSVLITDADDQGVSFISTVPRGLAIYDQTATNGTWQYKVGLGPWTNFGELGMSNALLLLGDGGLSTYKSGTRIRFVPTGPGTPTISFKAWDGTSGITGGYANIAATGGTTAFSNANSSASLSVVAPTGYSDNIYIGSYDNTIYDGLINRISKSITNTDPLLNNSPDYYTQDIEQEQGTNKIFWISGTATSKIAVSNADGTGVQTSLITGLTYCTGLAVGKNNIYYWNYANDFSSTGLYKSKTDGTGAVSILTGTYQDSRDIEFYHDKIYFQYTPDYVNFNIASMDTAGAGFTILYSGINSFSGLAVAKDTLYWTETDGTLKKKAIAGGSVTQLVSGSARSLNDLIVDSVTSIIYFMDIDANSNDRYTTIRSIATTGGAITTVGTVTGLAGSMTFNRPAITTLPISLLDFTGRYNEARMTSLLTWETASEQNNSKFILQRSQDGVRFTPVATLKGAGNSSVVNKYQYSDNVKNIAAAIIYYQLQQVDVDGRSTYSKVIALTKAADAFVTSLWPNPSKGYFNIHFNMVPEAPVSIRVFSNDGRLIMSEATGNQDFQLNLSSKQSGIYSVQLAFKNGTRKHFKIINE